MTYDQKEQLLQDHEKHTDEHGVNPDGCFYCGGNHPSDCCTSPERDDYWNEHWAGL